ncbi:zinc dependent phospholipase C family protein [Pseudodesulfovibrio senegalensis]|uniref:Zinc dependent phospholipase C family protein n=1 Tax=Pseudodesulfovibrio senegalensis TaxID=1721087 RepID=A0A6N6N1J6_9BACT|nr:zinc dependent phospholipase C family protein [Pseudodesulfovibrio senegalensis]KAB1438968.1 zinc dependent phospholipase C family protein [Pseudodesulfovibrio senegalensis]
MKTILTLCAGFCATLTAIMAFPADAMAWGPGAHLAIGQFALDNLHLFPALLAQNLFRHSTAFLYGCLSADIFIGKGTRFKPGHSHNWETGLTLMESARDPRTKAYARGYLTHLAADVVAHNYFVPNMLWNMPYGGKASHVYVEMQADLKIDWNPRTALKLFRTPSRRQEGALLSATAQRRWTFLIKKRLMMGSLNLCTRKTWDQSLGIAERVQPWAQAHDYLEDMLDLATRAAMDVLVSPAETAARSFDPIGSRNLDRVRGLRTRKLRRRTTTRFLFPTPAELAALPVRATATTRYAKAQGQ